MDYLEQLYTWIGSEDNTFTQRYTLEDFKNNMQKEDYVSSMYTWISSRDETIPDRYTLDFFTEKVKKKDTSIQEEMEPPVDVPSITTEMEEAGYRKIPKRSLYKIQNCLLVQKRTSPMRL